MKMLHTLALATALMVGAAHAQEIPVIADEPGVKGLPDDAVLDILGLELGMTKEEAEEALGQRMNTRNARIFLSDPETGRDFQHEYLGQISKPAAPLIGNDRFTAGQDIVDAELGTEAVGNRIMSIKRVYVPAQSEPISRGAFINLLIEKYGEPSGRNDRDTALAWMYGPDGKIDAEYWSPLIMQDGTMNSSDAAGRYIEGNIEPTPCTLSIRQGVSDGLWPYEYQSERELRDPDCVAGLVVQFSGAPEQMQQAVFMLVDGQRRIQNAEGLDKAVEEAMSADGPTTRNAPKL